MKKCNIIRALIYIALLLGTLANLYCIKRNYDSSIIYIQTNFEMLNSFYTPDELMEKYGNYVKEMKFPTNKYKYRDHTNVYIIDKKEHISIITLYDIDSFMGAEPTFTYCVSSVNCHYWVRIVINFIIILVGLLIAKRIEKEI